MTGVLLAQLAWVALRDAESLEERPRRTGADRGESDRLRGIADALFARAREAGQVATDANAAFGYLLDEYWATG